MKPTKELVLCSVQDRIGTITLNRPDKLNAFNLSLGRQLLAALKKLNRDDTCRVIVIQGAGKVFSAGGDIRQMLDDVQRGEDRAAFFRAPLEAFHEIVSALRQTSKPVLAAVHGAVAGVAFNMMLACDLKVATDTARFRLAFAKIGLSPDGGGTWFLPRLVGYARALELALLPGELDAKTAQEWGLVNWVVSEDEFEVRVRETAARLANGPGASMGRTKALLNQAFEHDLASQMEAERLTQVENASSPDFEEGLTAFIEKRKPRFE